MKKKRERDAEGEGWGKLWEEEKGREEGEQSLNNDGINEVYTYYNYVRPTLKKKKKNYIPCKHFRTVQIQDKMFYLHTLEVGIFPATRPFHMVVYR